MSNLQKRDKNEWQSTNSASVMIQRISDYLGIKHELFEFAGVYDPFVGIDAEIFIDPQLLETAKTPEFIDARKKIEKYFTDVITLITASDSEGDRAWRKARSLLTFKEVKGLSIGYGKKSDDGNAVGPKLANVLVHSAAEIIGMGIKDPAIFELLGLFEDDFGADRLSDMISRIVVENIFNYSERITKELKLKGAVEYPTRYKKYTLLIHPEKGKPILFLPIELLRDLPVALDRDGIDYVVRFNQELRDKLNQMVGGVWGKHRPKKSDYKALFFSRPDKLKEIVEIYNRKIPTPYDFIRDPDGKEVWFKYGQDFARSNPLILIKRETESIEKVENVVEQIILQFKKNIESNGLNKHLYALGSHRPEKYAQLLFFSTADAYCKANDLDLSPEVNSGTGAIDFKISKGYGKRVLVEMKLSTNGNITHGFSKQLPTYEQSESTKRSFLVIVQVSKNMGQIRAVLKLKDESNKRGIHIPKIYIINGLLFPSASRRIG